MSSGLTEQQVGALRRDLKARIAALREEIREGLERSDHERYADLVEQVHTASDEAVADLLSDVALAVIDLHVDRMRRLERALQRLDRGHCGLCEDCGGEIGYPRLEAVPWAERCTRCQEAYERTHAGQQPSTL